MQMQMILSKLQISDSTYRHEHEDDSLSSSSSWGLFFQCFFTRVSFRRPLQHSQIMLLLARMWHLLEDTTGHSQNIARVWATS
jgi:hypothetical protein